MGRGFTADERARHFDNRFIGKFYTMMLSLLLMGTAGCETAAYQPPQTGGHSQPPETNGPTSSEVILRAGDTIRVTFPGTPNLNTPAGQQIRPDGKITLPLLGEYPVAGKTPSALEKELAEKYKDQLISKEVNVTVESASFVVYVNGMVLRPGPVKANHPLTVLEAIMEAGGYDRTKANLKKVRVTRQESGRYKQYIVDVEKQMNGAPPFYLKPADVVDVREKFTII
jgi:polysaccharide export outer membrane protein